MDQVMDIYREPEGDDLNNLQGCVESVTNDLEILGGDFLNSTQEIEEVVSDFVNIVELFVKCSKEPLSREPLATPKCLVKSPS